MKPVCLITGSAGLLGSRLCNELSLTFDIMAVYKNNIPSSNSNLLHKIDLTHSQNSIAEPSIYCVQGDLRNKEDIRRVVEVAIAKYGKVDHIINAAADTVFHGKLKEIWQSEDYATDQLYINCIAPMLLVSAIYDKCWKDKSNENALFNRSIVNVSSMSGLYAYAPFGQAFYAASKSALNMLSMYLSLELAPYSIRVNTICPAGFNDYDSTSQVVEVIKNLLLSSTTGEILSIPVNK